VHYGRPLELRRVPHVDLRRVLVAALEREPEINCEPCVGAFDHVALNEALHDLDVGLRGPSQPAAQLEVQLRRDEQAAIIEWRDVQLLTHDARDPFNSFAGSAGLRLALAAKIIRAHGGQIEHDQRIVRVRIPLEQ
jgi:hypothetical protein